MYAIIRTGGKQYKVSPGDKIKVESLPGDVGAEVVFDQVLMVSDGEQLQLGAPLVAGAQVTARVLRQGRAPKVRIIKFRRRKHYMKRQGHRQHFTEIEITGITG